MRRSYSEGSAFKAKITMKMMSGIAHCGLKFYSNFFSFGNYNDVGTLFFLLFVRTYMTVK